VIGAGRKSGNCAEERVAAERHVLVDAVLSSAPFDPIDDRGAEVPETVDRRVRDLTLDVGLVERLSPCSRMTRPQPRLFSP
jgi:hypothetical protein